MLVRTQGTKLEKHCSTLGSRPFCLILPIVRILRPVTFGSSPNLRVTLRANITVVTRRWKQQFGNGVASSHHSSSPTAWKTLFCVGSSVLPVMGTMLKNDATICSSHCKLTTGTCISAICQTQIKVSPWRHYFLYHPRKTPDFFFTVWLVPISLSEPPLLGTTWIWFFVHANILQWYRFCITEKTWIFTASQGE